VGEYPIVVSGGKAQNYALEYVNGVLTVTEPSGIVEISAEHPVDIYHAKGYLVRERATSLEGLANGIYIIRSKGGAERKIIIRN
jgi:hypothetical protein